MSWRGRLATVRRVGLRQVLLARGWILLRGDDLLRARYPVEAGELVLDVGAYEGQFAAEMRSRWDATVWAVEPIPGFADRLKRRFAADDRVRVLSIALGGEEGTLEIALADDGSSAWINGAATVEVRQCDVAEVLEDNPVALLKINAEGAEFDVLDRIIATGQISQIRCLQVQFHRFAPNAVSRRRTIRRNLRQTHRCSWSVPWVWEQWVRRPEQGSLR